MPIGHRNSSVAQILDARVLAFGPLSRDIIRFLPYDAHYYDGVPDGYPLVVPVFHCLCDDEKGVALAECFGISPDDFAHHRLNPHVADLEKLRELCPPFVTDPVNDFIGLREAGFSFHYLP